MRLIFVSALGLALFGLTACGHSLPREKQAPCSPVAATGNTPCELIPINFASLAVEAHQS